MREYEEETFQRRSDSQFVSARTSMEEWYRATGLNSLNTSVAWGTANLAVYMPFINPQGAYFSTMALHNGAAANGNVSLGVYAPDSEGKPGTRLAVVTAAQSGLSVWQIFTLASTLYLPRGLYYLGCSLSSATGTCRQFANLTTNGHGHWLGSIFTEAAAHPLPATATPSAAGVATPAPEMALATTT